MDKSKHLDSLADSNIANIKETSVQLSQIVKDITNELFDALNENSENIYNYWKKKIEEMGTNKEYADKFIVAFLALKIHLHNIEQNLWKLSINNSIELLEEYRDSLTSLLRENGDIRSNYGFGVQEIIDGINAVLDHIVVYQWKNN